MKCLVFGKNGQLGGEFFRYLERNDYNYIALGRAECDITDSVRVTDVIENYKPDVIINCTAYNFVDQAEKEHQQAFDVNAEALKNLSLLCKNHKVFLIHYSTDYVFYGEKVGFYDEKDTPQPLNIYGRSKLAGEKYIAEILTDYLIFRVSWVYGKGKQNFLYKLREWAKNNDILKMAVDEFSVPTSTRTIVEVTMKALSEGVTGLYHLTNSGYASRYEWAKEYFRLQGIKKLLYPAYQSDFNLLAKRPKWSVMNNGKISKILGIEILDWKEELKFID
jgi:dTDP-4-dehydrorhamnose reductase